MAVLTVRRDDGSTQRLELETGVGVRVGRGEGRDVDLVASTDRTLSRHALTLTLTPRQALDVACLQSTGSVRVTRADGTVAAVLRRGERALLRGEQLDIAVYSAAGRIVTIGFESSGQPVPRPTGLDATRTAPRLRLWEVLDPPEGREWLTVAALAAVLTRRVKRTNPFGQPLRKELETWCMRWFELDTLSAGQLTTWLDKGLSSFGLEFHGDKTGVLGEYLLSNGLLGDDELDQVEAELRRRSGED